MDDAALRDARDAIARAITELKSLGVTVPVTLYLAMHALAYALRDGDAVVLPFNRGEPQQ